MITNLHSKQVPEETLAQAKTKIQEILALLSPYLVVVAEADRQVLPKMGQKTLSFVLKTHEYARQNPEFLPAFVSKADFDIDVADAVNLTGIKSQIDQLASLVDDTVMVAGSEAYSAALTYYNNVKLACRQNIQGAKVINDDLSARFSVRAKKVEIT